MTKQDGILKLFHIVGQEITIYQNWWNDVAKAIFRGKHAALNTFIKQQQRL